MPLGSVECFRVGSDWDAYVRRVKQFIALNTIEESLYVATLVTLVGAECYALMCDLCSPDTPEEKTFNELVKLVKEHLEPERSEIAERHIFRQRNQQQGESIRSYLQILRHLAKTCNFGTNLEDNLRDQFVSGLLSEEMRSRLFAEKSLDYKRAVELALALEAAERHAATASAPASSAAGAAAPDDGLHRFGAARRRGAGPPSGGGAPRPPCVRCGKNNHAEGRCRYKQYTCDACGEKGHLKAVCKKDHSASKRSSKATPEAIQPTTKEPTTIMRPVTVKIEPVNTEPEWAPDRQDPSQCDTTDITQTATIKKEPTFTEDLITIEVEPITTEPELTIKHEPTPCSEEFPSEESWSDESLGEKPESNHKYIYVAEENSCDEVDIYAITPNYVPQKRTLPKDHICHICLKGFEKQSFLNRHLRVHTKEKPYACEICNKQFSQRCSLTRHESIHTGMKPHSCGTCGKQYANASYLKIHKRTHTGEKPYVCGVCKKRFSVSSSFKRHARTHKSQ